MSNTVQSGRPVAAHPMETDEQARARLSVDCAFPAVAAFLADEQARERVDGMTPQLPADEPKTWTFTNAVTGEPVTLTCMAGCTVDHTADMETPTHPEDINCYTDGTEMTLPLLGGLSRGHGPEDLTVLGFRMEVDPFSTTVARRLPHLNIEFVEENWIEGLDPDALATVIGQLSGQLTRLRVAHSQLTAVRAEYRRRSA
ncbi:hypothetical protein M2158_001094 [Streptomyces sp. SAI-144]|uniref:DUF6907 domain-containing protein n=1 Tax=Streptomyces sp. SAI-144 TaxID=2940544 RepID=UPI0024761AE5|nr:hypothetical protein [Streptomyces sp. SAI-144]MDH6432617.1 hypothetical protein [Streptomyces sp. SAI-144]